jgi:hypothetical protein
MSGVEYVEPDAVVAVADLCARAGATEFEVGYLEDDVPINEARWYAQVRFRGALLVCDERQSPDEACDALARRILAGGTCTGCNRLVTLNEPDLRRQCRWHRDGSCWVRGCDGKRHATKKGVPGAEGVPS